MLTSRRPLLFLTFVLTTVAAAALWLPRVAEAAPIPDTTIESGPSGLTNEASPTFTFSADQPDATFECRVDAEDFGACSGEGSDTVGPLSDGPHSVEVRASTIDGTDPTPASLDLIVDTTSPETNIDLGPSDGETVGPATQFAFSAEPDSTFVCEIDVAGWQPCLSPVSLGPLSNGPHTFAVAAVDPATNQDPSPAERSFEVDALRPNSRITGHPPRRSRDQTPTFFFTANEPAVQFRCRVDFGSERNCTSPASYRLRPGQHTFAARAQDQYGNWEQTPAMFTFRVLSPSREPLPGPPRGDAKRLRISNIHRAGSFSGGYSVLTATAPRKWTIRNPSTCAVFGFENGGRRSGWGYGRSGRRIHARFPGGVTVGQHRIVIRCPHLRHRFTTIKSVQRWTQRGKGRGGSDTSSRARKGNCRFTHLFGGLTVDCWGGRYGIVKYHFALPSDARGIHRSADGAVRCCANGKVTKNWVTTPNGNLVYVVRVTGWRAYTVRHVHVRYFTKVSHRVRRHHTAFAKGYGKLR